MILTGAFVLALNCGNVFASEAGMTGESNTEATIVEENGAADNVQNPADSQVVNDQNGNSYLVNSADVPESGDPAVEPTEPPADPPAEMKQGWQDEDGGRRYYIDNNYVVGEQNIDGSWYYFHENGMMATGLTEQSQNPGNLYDYGEDGKRLYGWQNVNGVQYYFHSETGIMLKSSECKIDGFWYYFDENGQFVAGRWINHHNADYYYDDQGHMYYGWKQEGDKNYYLNKGNGKKVIGEKKIDGFWYYFNENGEMATGWSQHNDHMYYYQANGQMTYGEAKIDGHWYYFKEKSGIMATGWSKHNNHTYYYQLNGWMTYGEKKIDGKWYYFHERIGVMATGWSKHNGHTYYYQSNGQMTYGEKKISGYWYYFKNKTGVMATGLTSHSGKKYYYQSNGRMKYGWQAVGSNAYYFEQKTGVMKPYTFKKSNGYWLAYDSNGKQVKDLRSAFNNASSYVIKVNKPMNAVTVYIQYGDGSYTVPLVAFICSTGADTPTGTFYTPDKWRWLRMMGPSWGQWVTQITGDYLFHSVYYNSANNNNALSVSAYNNLGKQVSHGCIRLTAGDAKWIYDHCALQTKVVIYSDRSTYGPLGRPTAYKLPSWHTWDPTDPNMYYKCQQRGCH